MYAWHVCYLGEDLDGRRGDVGVPVLHKSTLDLDGQVKRTTLL